MKKLLTLALCGILVSPLYGCASKEDKVKQLIEDEKYEEAFTEIQNNPEELKTFQDEVTFNLAKKAADNNDYEKALEYLEGNTFKGAEKLQKETSKKKVDVDFMNTLGKSLDEYCELVHQEEKKFGPNQYVIPQKKELEYLKPYLEKEFYNEDLKKLAVDLINSGESRLKAFDSWNSNLYKTWNDNMSYNGDRIIALVAIDAIQPIQLKTEDAKDYLKNYKEVVENGCNQRIFRTIQVTLDYEDDKFLNYTYTIENITEDMIIPESGNDQLLPFGRSAVNRNGDIVGDVYGNGPASLRPGQKATGLICIPKDIGDIRNCWME